MQKLWAEAGLVEVETRRIGVERSFVDFDDFREAVMAAPTLGELFAKMPPDALAGPKTRVRTHLGEDCAGRISYGAWAMRSKDACWDRFPGINLPE